MKKKIAIFGSTGSIGTQTIDVIAEQLDQFEVLTITANNNADLLIQQALKFKPDNVVIANFDKYNQVKEALKDEDIKIYAGQDAIAQIVEDSNIDMVVASMVGYSGLKPVINAIKAGKSIALANKETLVVAGELIKELTAKHRVSVLPVDSEHSAIFQCLVGEDYNPIEKIMLTASGGPFRMMSADELKKVTAKQALKHPNWDMGAKITIDSATLMNKGFEMIEAKWLFDLAIDQIEVVVHPQSIVHSMVQFEDGAVKAQLGMPDMKVPIAYALSYPLRMKSNNNPRMSLADYASLTFEKPDMERFPNLALSFEAIRKGGNAPCILNAANEIVVDAFLKDRCSFYQMSDIIQQTLNNIHYIESPRYSDFVETDKAAREFALSKL